MTTKSLARSVGISNHPMSDLASDPSDAPVGPTHLAAAAQASRMVRDALAMAGVSHTAFALACGVGPSKADRWVCERKPESPTYRHLLQATGCPTGARVVAELLRALTDLVEPIPCIRRTLPERILDSTVALGELGTVTRAALADGRIDDAERIALLKAARRLESVAHDLIRDLLA